ncbi:MAG: lysophospholipid acyltransferase family protein [Phycisphaerae bacterium]|jgi:1-acyl-sn-glycerol-3-phosphate acyltransferase|nr:lysophospholipid acyltransferase family protein [Phycisphaerae bacterium]
MTDVNAQSPSQASTRSHPNPQLNKLRLPDTIESANPYYKVMRWGLRLLMPLFWKARVFGRHNEPSEGGVVFISNHQSFLDPMLVGFALSRPLNYMARNTLFDTPGLKQLMTSLNAFPVKRGTADTGALKEAMRRIKRGGQVLVFAEGTRTRDRRIAPFLPGVALLAQRAAKWIVPVVIDGAFEAWPRTQPLPGLGNIVVSFGQPIPQEEARKFKAAPLVEHVRQIMIKMQTDVRRRVGRPELTY